jgi:hypothetical protein
VEQGQGSGGSNNSIGKEDSFSPIYSLVELQHWRLLGTTQESNPQMYIYDIKNSEPFPSHQTSGEKGAGVFVFCCNFQRKKRSIVRRLNVDLEQK